MKNLLKTFCFWLGTLLLWELVLRLTLWGGLSARALSALPFTVSLAAFLTALGAVSPWRWVNSWITYMFLGLIALLYCVQTVYFNIFDSLLSLSYVEMGGEAIAGFIVPTLIGIGRSLPQIILILLPIPVLAVLRRREKLPVPTGRYIECAVALGLSVVFFFLGVPREGTGMRASAYYDMNAPVERQAEYFGLISAERLELKRMNSDSTDLATDVIDLTGGPETTDEGDLSSDQAQEAPDRNIMTAIDFDALIDAAEDETQLELSRYFSTLAGTKKNEYTGLFEGMNLIEICAESYCPYIVDPELTPTLYKLTHEGIVFDNFYCSFPGLTTNGEYSLNMGLLPDLTKLSFAASASNYVPFCLPKYFNPLGARSRAYHNYTAYYYRRLNSHPNMGYIFKATDTGLVLPDTYPFSDLDMMKATVDEYINDRPFLAYYMTFSSHTPFSFTDNDMSAKNRDKVEGMDAPEDVKAYAASILELEYGLEYLMDRLDEAGLLDKTVIVMTGDHYPYALSLDSHKLIAGDAVESDPFWRYKNSFICWSGAVEEPIHVDKYCCTQDILPTLLNLFGFEFDSRLLTGTDVFSDSTHIAVLQDGSFRTADLMYQSDTGAVEYFTPEDVLPTGYADRLIGAVRNQFSVSASILRSNYYGFAFKTMGIAEDTEQKVVHYSFVDAQNKWYSDALERLLGEGVVNGGNGFEFHGDDPVTRAEFAAMLCGKLGIPEPENPHATPYADLEPNTWQYGPMLKLWGVGLIDSGPTCGPDVKMTGEEAMDMAAKISAYLGLDGEDTALTDTMSQVLDQIAAHGRTDGLFTRGAAAVFVDSLPSPAPESSSLPFAEG